MLGVVMTTNCTNGTEILRNIVVGLEDNGEPSDVDASDNSSEDDMGDDMEDAGKQSSDPSASRPFTTVDDGGRMRRRVTFDVSENSDFDRSKGVPVNEEISSDDDEYEDQAGVSDRGTLFTSLASGLLEYTVHCCSRLPENQQHHCDIWF